MSGTDWQDCPITQRVAGLERWQTAQNSHLHSIDECLGELRAAEHRRSGMEALLKWILGFAGFSGIISLVSLFVKIGT